MAVPRPMLLALLGVILLGATFYASRSANQAAEAVPSAAPIDKVEVAPPAETPAKPAKPKKKADKPAPEQAGKAKKNAIAPAEPKAKAKAKSKSKGDANAKARPNRRPGRAVAMERAVANGKVAILFIRQPGAADDEATAAAVNSVKGKGVAVFTDTTRHLEKYGPIIAEADVTQAPAVVVVTREGATVHQGFVDEETLSQEVADARR